MKGRGRFAYPFNPRTTLNEGGFGGLGGLGDIWLGDGV